MSNTDLPAWEIAPGTDVRVKHGQWKIGNPPIWKERGEIIRTEEDAFLTALNRAGIKRYRVIVKWESFDSTGNLISETASLLPMMLEPYPSPGELETKG